MTRNLFIDAFKQLRPENFSAHALSDMFDHFDQVYDDEHEFDVIAICCDYAEYPTAFDAAREHGYEPPEDVDSEGLEDDARDWLFLNTTVIELGGEGYVVAGI